MFPSPSPAPVGDGRLDPQRNQPRRRYEHRRRAQDPRPGASPVSARPRRAQMEHRHALGVDHLDEGTAARGCPDRRRRGPGLLQARPADHVQPAPRPVLHQLALPKAAHLLPQKRRRRLRRRQEGLPLDPRLEPEQHDLRDHCLRHGSPPRRRTGSSGLGCQYTRGTRQPYVSISATARASSRILVRSSAGATNSAAVPQPSSQGAISPRPSGL